MKVNVFVMVLSDGVSALMGRKGETFRVDFMVNGRKYIVVLPRRFVSLLITVLRRPSRVNEHTQNRPMIASLWEVGDIRGAREIVGVGRVFARIVAIVLYFRAFFRFLVHTFIFFNRLKGEFVRVALRFLLNSSTR